MIILVHNYKYIYSIYYYFGKPGVIRLRKAKGTHEVSQLHFNWLIFIFSSFTGETSMKKMMKSKKTMLASFAMLLSTLVVLTTATFAWLSMNRQTNSNGMKLKTEISANLIIDDVISELQAVVAPTEANFSHTFSAAAQSLEPATHDSGGSYASNLKYVTNAEIISASTGLERTGTLSYANATTDNYVDFIVYIASAGKQMTGQNLVATISSSSIAGSGANKQDTLDATSIDFYVNDTYVGTLNVAGLDASVNNHSTAKTSVALLSSGTIPLNSSGYITVKMRCYVDGALLKSAGQAYINSEKVDTSDITLNVTFTASDAS